MASRDTGYLTVPEAAERYGISQDTIRTWLKPRRDRGGRLRRRITLYRSGSGMIYVDPAEIERMVRIAPVEPEEPVEPGAPDGDDGRR